MSLPYLAELDQERQKVFHKLAKLKDDFILAGGTAIMLQIGHRHSYDFDIFTPKPLTRAIINKIQRLFDNSLTIQLKTKEMVLLKTAQNIDIHCVTYPFSSLKEPVKTSSISVYHLDDLVSNKAYTLGRRPAWRDYVDLFSLLKGRYYSLEQIINLANKKFAFEFNDKLFLQQLVYFDDVRMVKTVFIKKHYTDGQIKNYLKAQVKEFFSGLKWKSQSSKKIKKI